MIKENILNFTAVSAVFILTGSSAVAEDYPMGYKINTVVVTEIVHPTSPQIITQLDDLDKIILEYEGQRRLEQAEIELELRRQETIEMAEWAESQSFVSRQATIDKLIKELLGQVGITPYGFGSTPVVWDCSGLTKWYLEQQGIEVAHSATAQANGGTVVSNPIAGDLVAFQKENATDYFHIGVYMGGGLMVHSANSETGTVLQSVEQFATIEKSTTKIIRY